MVFDGKSMQSFDKDFPTNVVIFGVNNNLSSYGDNRKNNLLVLGKGPTSGINWRFGASEKNFSIDFSKAKHKFCSSLCYNGDNSYLFINGK